MDLYNCPHLVYFENLDEFSALLAQIVMKLVSSEYTHDNKSIDGNIIQIRVHDLRTW